MINMADIIATSEGFWDTTIAWYDTAPIMIFISIPAMLIAFVFGTEAVAEDSMRKKAIYIGLCAIGVAYIISSWTILLTNWHPANVYSKPNWDVLVEEAYGVTVIADDADQYRASLCSSVRARKRRLRRRHDRQGCERLRSRLPPRRQER